VGNCVNAFTISTLITRTTFFHPADEKAVLLKEWDEHLYSTHRRQWEREQKKKAKRIADRERIIPNH
jgi:hypothetical protein